MKRLCSAVAVLVMVLGLAAFSFAGGSVHWCYTDPVCGPDAWGSLDPHFEACSTGMQQSPIDVSKTVKNRNLKPLGFNYMNTPLAVVNNGHTIQVNYQPGSTLTIDGEQYQLLQFHFHTPSENTVKGAPFAMEAHLVHINASGQLAVVGVLMEEDVDGDDDDDDDDSTNDFIQKIWNVMPAHEGEIEVPEVEINVRQMLPEDQNYYNWPGSLTTPPCSEAVRWFLLTDAVKVSSAQVEAFAEIVHHNNARPVQPINGRTIYKSDFDD